MYRLRATVPLAAATVASFTAAAPAVAHHTRLDRDRDGMPDRWERLHHVSRPDLDPDHDGLTNLQEYRTGHDPHRADNPRRPASVGTVSLFADGIVTIAFADGRTVSARITPSSELECEPAAAYAAAPVARAADHGSDDGRYDDHSGPGPGGDDNRYVAPSYSPAYTPPSYSPAYTAPAPQPAYEPPYTPPYTPPAAQPPVGAPATAPAPTPTPSRTDDPSACTPDEIAGARVHELETAPSADGPVVERLELIV